MDIQERIQQLVEALDKSTCNRLHSFATGRLLATGMGLAYLDDVVQNALYLVLSGKRRPRNQDLENGPAFEHYLRGVINSRINSMCQKTRVLPLPDDAEEILPDSSALTPDQVAAMLDEKDQLFTLLRQRCAPRHLPTIAAWEAQFEHADRIPVLKGRRKYVMEVRNLAKQIIRDILR